MLQQQKMQNGTKVFGNSRELDYPDSRWGISGILLSQKRFLSIKISHRQSQTMFGWTTRFYEAMIKNKLKVQIFVCVFIFVSHFLF
jgi:hypothetical protein